MQRAQFPPARVAGACSARRTFIKAFSALFLGAASVAVPVVSGLMVLLHPLRRTSGSGQFVRVTSLHSLPEDGVPRRYAVVADQVNAWNRNPAVAVGAVYLRRTGPHAVHAFNVVCPHAGCFVEYEPVRQGYLCPCHNSTFALDGAVNDPRSPAARGLDELDVEIRSESEVWVRFQNFRAGVRAKLPVS
jgi:menaquinol-cytochrome c reductase iron-sulfur subunit